MNAQIIEKDGRPEWAVIPYADYRELLALAEDMADIRIADEALTAIEAGEETLPLELVERLCEAANPLPVWREYRQLTPHVLAARVGLDTATLAALECGSVPIPADLCERLAVALEVDVDDLNPRAGEGRGGDIGPACARMDR